MKCLLDAKNKQSKNPTKSKTNVERRQQDLDFEKELRKGIECVSRMAPIVQLLGQGIMNPGIMSRVFAAMSQPGATLNVIKAMIHHQMSFEEKLASMHSRLQTLDPHDDALDSNTKCMHFVSDDSDVSNDWVTLPIKKAFRVGLGLVTSAFRGRRRSAPAFPVRIWLGFSSTASRIGSGMGVNGGWGWGWREGFEWGKPVKWGVVVGMA